MEREEEKYALNSIINSGTLNIMQRYKSLSFHILRELESCSELFSSFQREIGAACPTRCARCCDNPNVTCTPFELLPYVVSIVEDGNGDDYLEKLKNFKESHCFFVHYDNKELHQGFCTIYQYRPFICRSFGVSSRVGKDGQREHSVCRLLKSEKLSDRLKNRSAPEVTSLRQRLTTVTPELAERELFINDAFKVMLEKALFVKKYT